MTGLRTAPDPLPHGSFTLAYALSYPAPKLIRSTPITSPKFPITRLAAAPDPPLPHKSNNGGPHRIGPRLQESSSRTSEKSRP